MLSVASSGILSLIVQFITGAIESIGLTYDVRPQDQIVKELLASELIVQGIEFVFYLYLVYKILFSKIPNDITSHRYFDWFITTSVMLVNFVIFFKYLENKHEPTYFETIKKEEKTIAYILIANIMMLTFGYLGEIGYLNNSISTAIGFIPFAYIFKQIYTFVGENPLGNKLFYATFIVWGLYGVAAVLPFSQKNIFYNILDLFSKNAFGLFLFFFLRAIKTQGKGDTPAT
jgi:bacteriorhodopsin